MHGSWRKWVGAAFTVAALSGCGKNDNPNVVVEKTNNTPTASIPNDSGTTPAANPDPLDLKLHLPFDQACTNEIPADSPLALPPDTTLTGKNCGQLNDMVARVWNDIKFVGANGKPQTYIAELEIVSGNTPLGTIELLMQPDLAPN